MGTEWTGDADLVQAADRMVGSPGAGAAVAVMTPGREVTATAGCDASSFFELGSISKALTGMLYREAIERGAPRPRYSNLGFQLLGHAVAAADGRSYEQFLQVVLGAGFRAPASTADLGPVDLIGVDRFGRPRAAWVGEDVAPAGGVRASTSTLCGFLRSILDGTAPGLSALDPVARFTRRVGIGAGWITLEYKGCTITWHNGSTGGFSSWMGLDRAAGTGVVVLAATPGSVDRQGFELLARFAGS